VAEANKTRDHETIRRWTEERGGFPATVAATKEGDEAGLLRIDFPGYSGEDALERISWDDFFQKFDKEELWFLYQEETGQGELSRFSKFVRTDS
jgi:hypothetical protein